MAKRYLLRPACGSSQFIGLPAVALRSGDARQFAIYPSQRRRTAKATGEVRSASQMLLGLSAISTRNRSVSEGLHGVEKGAPRNRALSATQDILRRSPSDGDTAAARECAADKALDIQSFGSTRAAHSESLRSNRYRSPRVADNGFKVCGTMQGGEQKVLLHCHFAALERVDHRSASRSGEFVPRAPRKGIRNVGQPHRPASIPRRIGKVRRLAAK